LIFGLPPALAALRYFLPWNLAMDVGQQQNAAESCLLVGSQNYSILLILVVLLESILFMLFGLYRFSREEF
jgi:hypothetical protein